MSKSLPRLVLAMLAIGLSACDRQPLEVGTTSGNSAQFSSAETVGALFAEIRAVTAHYHRLDVAMADGYVARSTCIYNTPGGRGHIFGNLGLIDGVVDPAHPELLVYEPLENGEMRLVAIGFLVLAAAWDPFNTSAPVLAGQAFLDRRTPPFGFVAPNYVLFAWVWRQNPLGMHALYNPHVSCEFADVAEQR